MANSFQTKPPVWFWIVAVLLLLWELQGLYAFVQEYRLGADAMGPASDAERAFHASVPAWTIWAFAVAVGTGVLGALTLLARKSMAKSLFIVSLIGVIVEYGAIITMTEFLSVKTGVVLFLPFAIVFVGILAIWLTDAGIKRGWLR